MPQYAPIWGFAPDPTGGAYSAPPDPLAGLRGAASWQGRGGEVLAVEPSHFSTGSDATGQTPYWKSLFSYNSAAYCLSKMKFGVRRQNHTHRKVIDQNAYYENPIWWSSTFCKAYISISEPWIVQIWWNLVRKRIFWHSRGNTHIHTHTLDSAMLNTAPVNHS